jgi:hypothetical protein
MPLLRFMKDYIKATKKVRKLSEAREVMIINNLNSSHRLTKNLKRSKDQKRLKKFWLSMQREDRRKSKN